MSVAQNSLCFPLVFPDSSPFSAHSGGGFSRRSALSRDSLWVWPLNGTEVQKHGPNNYVSADTSSYARSILRVYLHIQSVFCLLLGAPYGIIHKYFNML